MRPFSPRLVINAQNALKESHDIHSTKMRRVSIRTHFLWEKMSPKDFLLQSAGTLVSGESWRIFNQGNEQS